MFRVYFMMRKNNYDYVYIYDLLVLIRLMLLLFNIEFGIIINVKVFDEFLVEIVGFFWVNLI